MEKIKMFQATKQIWNSVDMLAHWFTDALDSIWLKHDLKDKHDWLVFKCRTEETPETSPQNILPNVTVVWPRWVMIPKIPIQSTEQGWNIL